MKRMVECLIILTIISTSLLSNNSSNDEGFKINAGAPSGLGIAYEWNIGERGYLETGASTLIIISVLHLDGKFLVLHEGNSKLKMGLHVGYYNVLNILDGIFGSMKKGDIQDLYVGPVLSFEWKGLGIFAKIPLFKIYRFNNKIDSTIKMTVPIFPGISFKF